jgi:hypothetical protein
MFVLEKMLCACDRRSFSFKLGPVIKESGGRSAVKCDRIVAIATGGSREVNETKK